MIAVDTSALLAVLLNEPQGKLCLEALSDNDVVLSAATLTEALIVAGRQNIVTDMAGFISSIDPEVVDVTEASARRAAAAYAKWGKGVHRAALNFGDCFAYELAISRACPLLYIGKDFAKTDVKSAL